MHIETKVIQLANDTTAIQQRNESEALWGWSVLSVQITDQKVIKEGDSHGHESYGGDKYIVTTEVVTEHTNYATITYQRDLDDARTAKLVELEKQYNACNYSDFLDDEDSKTKEECSAILVKMDRDMLIAKIGLGCTVAAFILRHMVGLGFFELFFYIFGIITVVFFTKAVFTPEYRTAKRKMRPLEKMTASRKEAKKREIIAQAKAL